MYLTEVIYDKIYFKQEDNNDFIILVSLKYYSMKAPTIASKIKTEMKYFGTFIFTHHPSTYKARRRGRTRGTARIKCLNESKTELLPI